MESENTENICVFFEIKCSSIMCQANVSNGQATWVKHGCQMVKHNGQASVSNVSIMYKCVYKT